MPSKREEIPTDHNESVILEQPPPKIGRRIPPKIEQRIRCPICQHPFKTVELVDLHIDTCTGPHSPLPSSQSYNLRHSKSLLPSSSSISLSTPLPKLNYVMYNESKLRSLLANHGLPTHGNKFLLAARHKEFVNLYNANIDRRNPLSRNEILEQMGKWDVMQQGLMGLKRKDRVDSVEWGKKFEESFADLTKRARESVAKKQKVTEENKELANPGE